jgi:hypothetical protein
MNNLRSAAILGILLLAACSDEDSKNKTRLVVQNRSSEHVLVYVRYTPARGVDGEYDLDFGLEAASTVEYTLVEASKLEVKILRASDLQQLFLDSWTEKELDDLGDSVTVTLEP